MNAERLAKGLYWDKSLTLVSGCTPISPGCDNCWSAREAHDRASHPNEKIRMRTKDVVSAGKWTGEVRFLEESLEIPARIKKPTVFAVWNDLFHVGVTEDQADMAMSVHAIRMARQGLAGNPPWEILDELLDIVRKAESAEPSVMQPKNHGNTAFF